MSIVQVSKSTYRRHVALAPLYRLRKITMLISFYLLFVYFLLVLTPPLPKVVRVYCHNHAIFIQNYHLKPSLLRQSLPTNNRDTLWSLELPILLLLLLFNKYSPPKYKGVFIVSCLPLLMFSWGKHQFVINTDKHNSRTRNGELLIYLYVEWTSNDFSLSLV